MSSQSGEIREGFLCPMCMKDLGTVSQLQSHFEEAHSTEDKVALNQLRGLFDKAKKKFLGNKDEDDVQDVSRPSTSISLTQASSLFDVDYWQHQDVGVVRSWTDLFRGFRDTRVDKYVVETNKLLIRLDKLVNSDIPMDSSKRKAFEKTVVSWMHDSDVKSCKYCARSFSMTRRRHHCRLCGGIMCDRCSQFLTLDYAKKLTNPSFNFAGGRDQGFLKRSGSSSSLNSLWSSEGDPHLRACQDCRKLLERRDIQMEQRNTKSFIVQLYEKLKLYIQECEKMLETYLPMVESLSKGESTYSLPDAQKRRQELIRRYEFIDQLSKRIAILDADKEDGIPPRQVILQKAIRAYASNFMQENMMGLQSLPSEELYDKLQKKHTAEMQKLIARERQAVLHAQAEEKKQAGKEKFSSPGHDDEKRDHPSHEKHRRNKSEGWKPAEHSVVDRNVDPMLQQMEIIKQYIQQARQAHKWDEVNMLEQNLKDLQQEYASQQKETWS